MEQQIAKIGIREFRNNLSRHLNRETLAITNHGRTVGYYIPVPHDPTAEDLANLQSAAARLSSLLVDHNISEDTVVAEFRQARAKAQMQ